MKTQQCEILQHVVFAGVLINKGVVAAIFAFVFCVVFLASPSWGGGTCRNEGVETVCFGDLQCTDPEGGEGLCQGIVHPPSGPINLSFIVEKTQLIDTTSAGGFETIVESGGVLVNTLIELRVAQDNAENKNTAEGITANVRNTAQVWKGRGFDVDQLFHGGLFIIIATLRNIDDFRTPVISPIKAVVETLGFIGAPGFPPEPNPAAHVFPALLSANSQDLSATSDDGRPGSKQFITNNTLEFDSSVTVVFVVGLQQQHRFQFTVNVEGRIRPGEG